MEPVPLSKDADSEPAELAARAAAVLEKNDMDGWTRAAPNLYPHQWSWDSAFIAIGLAHLDVGRAAAEIQSLLDHQWKTGKVPHIVFNPDAPPESYFPGPDHWASAADPPDAPCSPARTFLVKDVLFSAILVRANEALLEIAEIVEAPDGDRDTIRAWIQRGHKGLDERWNPELELCLDYDLRAGCSLVTRTIAGLSPLFSGSGPAPRRKSLLQTLDSPFFAGHPDLRWPLPPSTSPGSTRAATGAAPSGRS